MHRYRANSIVRLVATADAGAPHCARAQTFMPLVEKCKALGRAMRIGTNHGSLSARILSYYGDTPRGMVESAFEFADICRSVDYHNFLFSMKASNPLVMVQARARARSLCSWLADQAARLSARMEGQAL